MALCLCYMHAKSVLYSIIHYEIIWLAVQLNLICIIIMKKLLKKLVMPCGYTVMYGETFRTWLVLGKFWLHISQDRMHISFEYLPF